MLSGLSRPFLEAFFLLYPYSYKHYFVRQDWLQVTSKLSYNQSPYRDMVTFAYGNTEGGTVRIWVGNFYFPVSVLGRMLMTYA